eukprot:TRINITY_DN175_c0_g1_i4.p1 TRINITY_DN175_c0_g1~~TRINITY_DN175_c0_g1_i4.p1  ORF type:complete len:108 (+),score=20.43 TRINITY_DN175_c0_g1_i4:91-414(+)
MSKEVSLFKSIQEDFSGYMKTPSSRKQFLTSFKAIVDGVSQSSEKVSEKLEASKAKLDQHNDKMQKLIEKQRKYYKAVKDFQEECNRNEQLEDRIDRLRRKYASQNR